MREIGLWTAQTDRRPTKLLILKWVGDEFRGLTPHIVCPVLEATEKLTFDNNSMQKCVFVSWALASIPPTNLAARFAVSYVEANDASLTSYPVLYQVKPSSNQVNLASCCVMPPDLTAFAKEFDIQLLTHNDPKGELEFHLFSVTWMGLLSCWM